MVKPSGQLASLIKARKDGGLLADIHTHVLRKAGEPSDRRQDVIHPSEMAKNDWCPRQTFYRIRDARAGLIIPAEQHSVDTLLIFKEGDHAHTKWQRWLDEMGELWGRWRCLHCDHLHKAITPRPEACARCGSRAIKYAEVPLWADDLPISGSADGYLPGRRTLVEIKTIGKGTVRLDDPDLLRQHTYKTAGKTLVDLDGLWASLSRPLKSHVKQGCIYHWLARQRGLHVDTVTYLYEFKLNQRTRSFEVRLSDRVLLPLLKKAAEIRDALDHGGPIPERAHTNPTTRPCATCMWASECWKDDAEDRTEPGHRRRLAAAGGEARPRTRRVVRAGTPRRPAAPAAGGHHGAGRPAADDALPGADGVERVLRRAARPREG